MDENLNLLSKDDFYIISLLLYGITAFLALIISNQIDFFKKYYKKTSKNISILICILLIVIVGFRAYDVGTDTKNYYTYNWVMNLPAESNSEILFFKILDFVKHIEGSFTTFLLLIAAIFYLFIYKAFNNISKVYKTNLCLILFSFISLFFATSISINVMRQGLALALLIFAYSNWLRFDYNKKAILILTLILSFLAHTTSLIPIFIFLFLRYIGYKINIKWFYILFVIGVILSAANFGLLNMAPFLKEILGDQRRTSYLTNSSERYTVGFKPQFVFFNTVFLIVFVFINTKLKNNNIYFKYQLTLKYYIVMSFLFFMAFQIPYSDRWGLFSWIFIPILLAPIYGKFINYKLKTITTIFLIFIYTFFTIYASTK